MQKRCPANERFIRSVNDLSSRRGESARTIADECLPIFASISPTTTRQTLERDASPPSCRRAVRNVRRSADGASDESERATAPATGNAELSVPGRPRQRGPRRGRSTIYDLTAAVRSSGLRRRFARTQVYQLARERERARRADEREKGTERGRKGARTSPRCPGKKREAAYTHARTAGTEGGSGVPYTVTFVKARLSPYTGNVHDGRHLYRVRLKSQECCFLSRLLFSTAHARER